MDLDALADLVFPRRCVGCGRAGLALCTACAAVHPVLRADRRSGLRVACGARYDGPLRTAILSYKERGRRDLAAALVAVLVRALGMLLPDLSGALLVPVPSARAVAAARGGSHVARLARGAARQLPVGAGAGVLRIVRSTLDSADLSAIDRATNLAGAMRARCPPQPGRRVVIVDDLVTTGATLAEARRALEAAGWHVTDAATVAWTPLRARLSHPTLR